MESLALEGRRLYIIKEFLMIVFAFRTSFLFLLLLLSLFSLGLQVTVNIAVESTLD